ncbi:hypothetical protein [Embleya sp. MST-111070]
MNPVPIGQDPDESDDSSRDAKGRPFTLIIDAVRGQMPSEKLVNP